MCILCDVSNIAIWSYQIQKTIKQQSINDARNNNTVHTFPEMGNIATVRLGPPIVSSRWLTSTSGVSPLAKLDVHEITNSSMQIPASIKARVAALTHTL